MNRTEQGVRQLSEVKYSLIHLLLLAITCLSCIASAETPSSDAPASDIYVRKHHVFIIHSAESKLQSNIIRALSENLYRKLDNVIVTRIPAEEKISAVDYSTDLVIGIGPTGMKSANKHYPKAKKLYISTGPQKHRADINFDRQAAILYMTPSYCRQIHFIKLINDDWNTVSLLNSQKRPIDNRSLKRCAKKYGLKLYTVNTSPDTNLSDDIRRALDHSDALLALPDKNIYNSKTVKNILLTSYRHRKPVIAFSSNFVSAGALASIYSSTEQIGESAGNLIKYYFEHGYQFKKTVNYPQSFEISFNRQVFKALGLSIPDTDKVRQKITNRDSDTSGYEK